jgi:hypothetical protein
MTAADLRVCVKHRKFRNVYLVQSELEFRKVFEFVFQWFWRRSQCPSCLSHEISSATRTLGLWVRIPLEAWVYVCVFSVFVLSCLGSGLTTGWSPFQGVLWTARRIHIFLINSDWEDVTGPNPSRQKKMMMILDREGYFGYFLSITIMKIFNLMLVVSLK